MDGDPEGNEAGKLRRAGLVARAFLSGLGLMAILMLSHLIG